MKTEMKQVSFISRNTETVQTHAKLCATLHHMTASAWTLANCALWPQCIFSKTEVTAAKSFIRNYLLEHADAYQAYLSFCQRILLVREYVSKDARRFVPLPTHWLDVKNEKGFAGTEQWHTRMLRTRKSMPLFKIELKAIAEAVLEMLEAPSLSNFQYWTGYFRERCLPQLYQLFLSVVLSAQYENY